MQELAMRQREEGAGEKYTFSPKIEEVLETGRVAPTEIKIII